MIRNLLVMVVMGLMALTIVACGAAGGGGDGDIRISATDFKYDPGTVTVKAGAKVKITMANKGALEHTLIVKDASGKDLSPKLSVPYGQTKNLEFTAPAAGAYELVCDIAGHKEQGMLGKLIVQ